MTSALRAQPDVILNPDVGIRDISYPDRICRSRETTFTVQLYNAGQFTGIGTVELYIDGDLAGSTTIDIQPGELLNVPFQVDVPPSGSHQVTAVYDSKFSTESRTETFEVNDNDCDGWLNEIEAEYGTNPDNPDTDGDGVMDSQDVDPLRDATVELYLFRARALDPAEDDDRDWNVDLRIEATFKAGNVVQTIKENLPDNTQDVENIVMLGNSISENIQREAVAVLEFNPPDNVDTVEIDLKLVDRDSGFIIDNPDEIMDISPKPGNNEAGKVAELFFSLKNGTWWGDDYINDHKVYFGYGHLSGADDSTEDYTNGGEYDAEPFSKYYDDLEALGYDLNTVNITGVRGWDGIDEVSYSPGRDKLLKVVNPAEVVEFTLSLPDGKEKKVVLVNTRGARVLRFSPSQKTLKFRKIGSTFEMTPWDLVKEEYASLTSVPNSTLIKLKNSKIDTTVSEPKDVQIVQVSDIDEDDAEIWFLIKTNDEDGIPFYREIELNRELENNGSVYSFDPSDGFGIDDPDEHQGFIKRDAYGDYDGDGVPNAVELFIGKNPVKPDVLGIKLSVVVGWDANQTYLTQLVKGFQRASQVIYDYTDGYAMITEISIKNNVQEGSEEWKNSDIVIYPDEYNSLGTYVCGGYWDRVTPNIVLHRIYASTYPNAPKYYRGIAHEIGHSVFWLYDEYYDKNKVDYRTYLPGGLENPPHSIMNDAEKYTEASTWEEYDRFHDYLKQLFGSEWFTHTTFHYYYWNVPGWNVLFRVLKGGTIKDPEKGYEIKVNTNICIDLDFNGSCDSEIGSYVSLTGPYTGVGYFMEVIVNDT